MIHVLVLLLAAQQVRGDWVRFMESDEKPAFSIDTETHAVTFENLAQAALSRLDCLKDNDPFRKDGLFVTQPWTSRRPPHGANATWTRFSRPEKMLFLF